MKTIQELKTYLQTPRKIVILPHQKPDGDAMGSSLGLYHYLKEKTHTVSVVSVTDYPAFLKWMPGKSGVVIMPFKPHKAKSLIAESDVIFCLDFNGLGRINELGPEVKKAKGVKVMIDHHTFPDDFDDIRLWDETASSTCEMIYRLIAEEWEEKDKITEEIATCLYTGIMTDTGSFRFDVTTARVHRVAADLLETGIQVNKIHENVYDTSSENRLRLVGHALLNCMRVLADKRTAYFVISKEDAAKYKMESGDTEGLVNYGLSMKGIDFSIMILEDEDRVKMSFRCKGDFAVNEFAAQYFEGGGHQKAAGGKSFLTLAQTEEKFLLLLSELRP